MDWTKWVTDEVLEDHTKQPIIMNAVIKNLSQKFDLYIDTAIIAKKKEKK